jgi:hypothetical protein
VSGQEVTIPTGQAASVVAQQASSDEQLLALWLDGRGCHTRRAYGADADAFLAFTGKPLRFVTIGDVQAFGANLAHLVTATGGASRNSANFYGSGMHAILSWR